MKTQRKAIAGALAFALMSTSSWAASNCIQDQDLIALRATALQQQMMVAGYACHEAAAYNRFVELYRPQLLSSDAELMAFFIHRNAATGADDYNAFKTKLANIAAIRAANDTDTFCGHARAAFRAAMSTEKASLSDLVAVHSDSGPTSCSADPVALASIAPVPKPTLAVPGLQPVVVPQGNGPLTAQKLAQLYPNDPPPFSLPTTPPTGGEPPLAAPTAHVAVDALPAKPASVIPTPTEKPILEAQGSGPSLGMDPALGDVLAPIGPVATLASVPAGLAAAGAGQKESMAALGASVAANTAGKFAQAPEAMAASAPAEALSDAEVQALALDGVSAAEANAPAAPPPQRALAAQPVTPRFTDRAQDRDDADDPDEQDPAPAPVRRGQYAAQPDAADPYANTGRASDDLYTDDRGPPNAYANAYANDRAPAAPRYADAPPPQPRAAPANYRYYNDRYGTRYAEDSNGQNFVYDARRGRWEPVTEDEYAPPRSYQPNYQQSYAYSPYYRAYPPGYYGR